MTESNHEALSCARLIEGEILKAVESIGHKALADALQIDESYISKLKGSDQKINIGSIALMLATLGLQVVRGGAVTVDRGEYRDLLKRDRNDIDARIGALEDGS